MGKKQWKILQEIDIFIRTGGADDQDMMGHIFVSYTVTHHLLQGTTVFPHSENYSTFTGCSSANSEYILYILKNMYI